MSSPVCVPSRRSDEFLRGFGAARRRMEVERISAKCSTPELGSKFGEEELSFLTSPGGKISEGLSSKLKGLPPHGEEFGSFLEMLRRKKKEGQFAQRKKS